MSQGPAHLTITLNQSFPLVPRPRPPARPLPQRIEEIGHLATAASNADGGEGLVQAAEALNKAALLASDCAIHDLARQLCWDQFDAFRAAAPLNAATAELAVQPIVNLGRLLIRDRQPDRAHALFLAAFTAVDTRDPAAIDGTPVDLARLTDGEDSRRHLRRFLWTILLADGTRALTGAGRWDEAVDCLRAHKGVGSRMLDGRQTAIIERCLAGHPAQATALLDTSVTTDPWERAVTAVLRAICNCLAGRLPRRDIEDPARQFLELDQTADTAVFRTRLGLTVLDLAEACGQSHADVAARILHEVSASTDAYTVRFLLEHSASRKYLTPAQTKALADVIDVSGLGRGHIPEPHMAQLMDHVRTADTALIRALHDPACRARS